MKEFKMSEIYYDRLEEVDKTLEDLVDLKDAMYKRLVVERNQAVSEVMADFKKKVKYLQARFDASAAIALARLGETIPDEVKKKINEEKNDDNK